MERLWTLTFPVYGIVSSIKILQQKDFCHQQYVLLEKDFLLKSILILDKFRQIYVHLLCWDLKTLWKISRGLKHTNYGISGVPARKLAYRGRNDSTRNLELWG